MKQLQNEAYNIHPSATLFISEFAYFIQEHFEIQYDGCPNDYISFADHFYHGISTTYPDTRVLNPTNKRFYIYCGYWTQCEYLNQQRYGEEFKNNCINNVSYMYMEENLTMTCCSTEEI